MIRSVSGSSQKLDFNNYSGIKRAYTTLANLKDKSGNSIEWVRDDYRNIKNLSAPGFYIVKMIELKKFTVDEYLIVDDEKLELSLIGSSEGAFVKYPKVNPGSEIIYTTDGLEFKPDIDYTINYDTGAIVFTQSVTMYDVRIDYQTLGGQRGPFDVDYYSSNNSAIPGVILAFGDRLKEGDEQVVVIGKEKRDIAKIFSGRWNLSLDLTGIAQDPDQQERLLDYVVTEFWAFWQEKLTGEGMHISEFSLSGESEDLETEIPEEYYFTGGLSFTVETDWELEIPLIREVRRVNVEVGLDSLKDELTDFKEFQFTTRQFDERMMNSGHALGIQPVTSLEPIVVTPSPIVVKTRKYPE